MLTLKIKLNYELTALFSGAPALNFGCFEAGICISSPVRGFLPVLAALLATEKLPKPTILTSSPDERADAIDSKTPSTARPASAFVNPDDSATLEIKSFLFT